MPKFAANLSMMFTEHAFLDRFDAAAEAGFAAVEFLFPYDHPPEAIAERLSAIDSRRPCSTCRPVAGRMASAGWRRCPTGSRSSSPASRARSTMSRRLASSGFT